MILVRLAVAADIPALPEIERSADQAFIGADQALIADGMVTEAEAYPPLIAAQAVHVAEMDGELVGFVTTEVVGSELHVWELAVRFDRQRRGAGRALMAKVRDIARLRGCSALTLTTFRTIPFNAPFYGRLGFQVLDTPCPRLASILADEAARGLTDRCAMRGAL